MSSKRPQYIVQFKGRGFGAPDKFNPNGVKVTGSGYVIVNGERPATSFHIPFEVIQHCKSVFMEQTCCARFAGDGPGREFFPTVRLGKSL